MDSFLIRDSDIREAAPFDATKDFVVIDKRIPRELDRVALLSEQEDRAGTLVPQGTVGTIVAVLKGGRAFIVEFTRPVAAVVTVRASLVKPAAEAA